MRRSCALVRWESEPLSAAPQMTSAGGATPVTERGPAGPARITVRTAMTWPTKGWNRVILPPWRLVFGITPLFVVMVVSS